MFSIRIFVKMYSFIGLLCIYLVLYVINHKKKLWNKYKQKLDYRILYWFCPVSLILFLTVKMKLLFRPLLGSNYLFHSFSQQVLWGAQFSIWQTSTIGKFHIPSSAHIHFWKMVSDLSDFHSDIWNWHFQVLKSEWHFMQWVTKVSARK